MKKILTLSIITFISIFMIGTTLVTAGGVPFEALQRQIDDLQQQINDIQTGTVKSYLTKNGDVELSPNENVDVMTLRLPAGIFINNITIQASYYPSGIYEPGSQSFLECGFVNTDGDLVTGDTLGGSVVGTETHSKTLELEPSEPMEVILRCKHSPFDENETLAINSAVWTAIKVDYLERQLDD